MKFEEFLALAKAEIRRNDALGRADSANLVFAARQLEEINAQAYNVEYAPLDFVRFVPLVPGARGAKVHTYRQFDRAGVAEIVADYAKNLPRVDLKMTEFSTPYRDAGASYSISLQELEGAAFAGVPINADKAEAARMAVEEKAEKILRVGDAAHGMFGLLNVPGATTANAPNGVSASPLWANKTPDEILDDLNNTVNAQVALTKTVEKPNTVILPVSQYGLISSKSLGDGREGTILQFFLKNSPYIKNVFQAHALAGAGVGGVDRAIFYNLNPRKVFAKVNREFMVMPPQVEGLSTVWNCLKGMTGVVSPYPLSITYLDGI